LCILEAHTKFAPKSQTRRLKEIHEYNRAVCQKTGLSHFLSFFHAQAIMEIIDAAMGVTFFQSSSHPGAIAEEFVPVPF
jgi:hypothetical protein